MEPPITIVIRVPQVHGSIKNNVKCSMTTKRTYWFKIQKANHDPVSSAIQTTRNIKSLREREREREQ
jgi:hypothetical protein